MGAAARPQPGRRGQLVVLTGFLCLDIGSTQTKAARLDPDGTLLATAQHPTTPPEVLTGIDAATAAVGGAGTAEVLACSSAGGGLRLVVLGQERLVSAEAGYRVALSAGAKVVGVFAGPLAGVAEVLALRPDVVLLAGGTDGGDTRTLLHNAGVLAAAGLPCPVVLAGNVEARPAALELLAGCTVVVAGNVLPDVGELAPGPARAAIRSVFLEHVIGGKGLSAGTRFRELVRTVTPDAVLTGVSRLASVLAGGAGDAGGPGDPGAVLVVDVGGATTDVYSAVSAPPERAEHVVALPPDRRTVEGDIGMRWSAAGVVAEAKSEGLLGPADDGLAEAADRRAADIGLLPADDFEAAEDARLAALAVLLAVRRHLRLVGGALGPRGATLLVLSGGVFRHATPAHLATVERSLRADPVLRPVLRHATVTVDRHYVLAPAGLLTAAGHATAADTLLRTHLATG